MNRGEGDGEERRAAEIFAVIARSGRSCASMRSRHLHILVRRSDVAIQRLSLRMTFRCKCFHRPAAGEALFTAEKDPKRLAPGARRLDSCLADPLRFLAAAGRRRTRTSMCSNSGAYSLRLPAMLAALYGALSPSSAHPCATTRVLRFIPQRHIPGPRMSHRHLSVPGNKPRSTERPPPAARSRLTYPHPHPHRCTV